MTVDIDIQIREEAYYKMKTLTQEANGEIAGLLLADFEDKSIIIDDVVVLKQEAGTGSVDIDDKAIAEFMKESAKTDKSKITKLRGWWHSHDNMETFWSGIDDNTIDKFTKLAGLCISINTNKKNKFLVRLDIKKPRISIDKISYDVKINEDSIKKIREWSKEEIKKKVKSYPQTHYNYNKKKQGTVVYYMDNYSSPSVPSRVYWLDEDLYQAYFRAIRKKKIITTKERIDYAKKLWNHQVRRMKNKKTRKTFPSKYVIQQWEAEEADMLIVGDYDGY